MKGPGDLESVWTEKASLVCSISLLGSVLCGSFSLAGGCFHVSVYSINRPSK